MQPASTDLDVVTTDGGFLLVLSIAIPVAGVLIAFVVGGRHVERIAFATILLVLAIVAAVVLTLHHNNGPIVYVLGAWTPPLGVALRADGLSTIMMTATAVVICSVALYARTDFRSDAATSRAATTFWLLLTAISGALNTVFLAGDLFTLYVALELVTFAAVPLVCLDGRADTVPCRQCGTHGQHGRDDQDF